MASPKSVPARRIRETVIFHYLGDHPARLNINSLRNVRDEVSAVIARFDRLQLERRKPNLETDPRGYSHISFLEEIEQPQKPAIKIVQPTVSKPIVRLVTPAPGPKDVALPGRRKHAPAPKAKTVKGKSKRRVVKAV